MVVLREPVAPPTRLEATTPVAFLDHFRVPYRTVGPRAPGALHRLGIPGAPCVCWPSAPPVRRLTVAWLERPGREPVAVAARLHDDEALLTVAGDDAWVPARRLTAADGTHLATIWRHRDGSLLLPFDPDEALHALLSERYVQATGATRGLRRRAMRAYYRLRPLMPRRLQLELRRAFAHVQARSAFPRWPVEPALHDLLDVLAAMTAEVAGTLPCLGAWPDGWTWAVVLTHDVELEGGWQHMGAVADAERARGLRSAFNIVPERYPVDDATLAALAADGFEIGVHGLRHDGRDLESAETLRARLPGMRAAAQRWGATGFRSPATHRRWEWMPQLGFDHDSSAPDTDPFEPQGGGCCSWLPFLNGALVELPLTLAQDHTLFTILGRADGQAWLDKAAVLRARGGMALIDTHPDYLREARVMAAYEHFLDHVAGDPAAWHALPRDVAAWWRRRAASRLEWDGSGWTVSGPAAGEARIELKEGSW